jgi:hypothetical protein
VIKRNGVAFMPTNRDEQDCAWIDDFDNKFYEKLAQAEDNAASQ